MSTFESLETIGNPEKEMAAEISTAYHKKIRAYGIPSCQSIVYYNAGVRMFNDRVFTAAIGFFSLAIHFYGAEHEKNCIYHNRRDKLIKELQKNIGPNNLVA